MEKRLLSERITAGRSVESIAREAGRPSSTVAYWVAKHGLQSHHAARHRARTPLTQSSLAALVADGLTVRQIAERLDRSPTTIRYWLRRHGLVTVNRPGRKPGPLVDRQICARHGVTAFAPSGDREVCASCRAGAVSEWRRRAKRTLVAEAGGACVVCGYDRYVGALQFHHIDPRSKRFGLGGRGLARSIAILREEAAKCVLLCANCHSEVEAGHATIGGAPPDRG